MLETAFARWSLEIASVNRKGLDITVNLPPFLLFLDPKIRSWVAACVERGAVTVRVGCELKETGHVEALLKNEKQRWEKIGKAVGFPHADITLPFLLEQAEWRQMPATQEKTACREAKNVWDKGAKSFLLMKEAEGAALAHDIAACVKRVHRGVKEIERHLPELEKAYLARLKVRLALFELDPEKLKAEAALQASRDDVHEELVRLHSHLKQMTQALSAKTCAVGRTLEFLAHEMGREVSTLSAKVGTPLIHNVLRLKAEVEKIREQVQNVE